MLRTLVLMAAVVPIGLAGTAPLSGSPAVLKTELLDSPPKFIKDSDGNFSGLCIELMKLIEQNSNFKFSYPHNFTPTGRAETNLKNGDTDVHFGFSRTPEREKDVVFLEPLYEIKYVLLARNDDPISVSTVDDVKKLGSNGVVLTLLGTGIIAYAKGLGFTVEANSVEILPNLIRLKLGKDRFLMYHDLGLFYELKDPKFKGIFKVMPLELQKTSHWLAVSKNLDSGVKKDLSEAIRKLKQSGKWKSIITKYTTLQ
jgi:polar amino acid transport system substrate-binding protein